LTAVRGAGPEGEDAVRPEAASRSLHEGAGDLQGTGAVAHDGARRAVEACPQGSDRLQALAVRPSHVLWRGHQGDPCPVTGWRNRPVETGNPVCRTGHGVFSWEVRQSGRIDWSG